jgi:hypothetical protein
MAGLLIPADLVAAELRRWASEPIADARAVCALSVLAYVERACGRRLRPSPRLLSPIAQALIRVRPGNYERFAAFAMAQLGCPAAAAPQRGDVGLVPLAAGLTAAICVEGARGAGPATWAARGDGLVVIEAVAQAAAWRVECPRP